MRILVNFNNVYALYIRDSFTDFQFFQSIAKLLGTVPNALTTLYFLTTT